MQNKILVVDDEHEIADLVTLYLSNEGYQVFTFYSAKEALVCIKEEALDLAILDVMMPEVDGFAVCQKIRESYTYPIIMLTAKDEEVDKITGLTLGADDYITKPFRPLELVARVKAQLRRYKRYNNSLDEEENVLMIGGLVMNIDTRVCTLDERPLAFTPTEFTILRYLCQKKGVVVSSEELFHAAWGNEFYNKNTNSISVHIRHIREKMGESIEEPRYIKTVWGVGYKLEVE